MEKEKKFNTVIYKIVVCSIMIIGIVFRLYWIKNHFTHFDDIGLITCLVSLKEQGESLMEYHRWSWTYAPLQVVLSGILVNPSLSYTANLILGRLPSCIAGILSVWMMYRLIGYVFKNSANCKKVQLVSLILMALSWENIIYSAQAEPYEIGVLCIILMTIYLVRISREHTFSIWLMTGLSVFVLYSQYHAAVFLAAMYIGVFFTVNSRKKLELIATAAISILLSTPLIIDFLKGGMLGKSINWNGGIHAQFLFPYSKLSEIISLKAAGWFIKNILFYIQNFFVSNQNNIIIIVLSIVFALCCFWGFIEIHKRKNLAVLFYIDISGVIFFLLIVMKKFCLAPSRHLLLLYPIVLLLFCYGCSAVLDYIRQEKTIYAITLIWGCLMLASYMKSTLYEIPLRQNLVLSGKIEELIQDHKPDMIVTYYGFDFYLIPFLEYEVAGGKNPFGMNSYKRITAKDRGSIMLIGIGRQLDDTVLPGIQETLNYISESGFLTEEQIAAGASETYEINTNTEVEYARDSFFNFPNGLYIYFYR